VPRPVENRAIHVAIGVNLEGNKDVPGLWTADNEGARFWLQVLTEIQNRAVRDIFHKSDGPGTHARNCG
jgi:putative transposase